MAVVGAYARVDMADRKAVCQRLETLSGVSLFDLDDCAKVGIIIEANDLDDAHATLRDGVEKTAGVLGAWPIYANIESD